MHFPRKGDSWPTALADGPRYVYRVKAITEAGMVPRSRRVMTTTGGRGPAPRLGDNG